MSTPLVSIIIPIFNQLHYTKECLNSIYRFTDPATFELIIVDNHSTDESLNWLAEFSKAHSNLRVLALPENRGFSPAVNAGANLSITEFLLFLNNDTVVTAGWLEALTEVGKRDGVGVVGAKLIYPETNTINHIGYVYSRSAGGFVPIYHHFSPDQDCVNYEREFQALLGACLLIRRELFNQNGGFALYGLEDIDLCLKLHSKGFKIIYTPKATVYHHGSVTLRNSPLGSFPVTSVAEFNQAWPADSLNSDDTEQSALDGFDIKIKPDGSFEFKENITRSMQLFLDAQRIRESGDLDQACDLLKESIELFGRNKDALIELISLFLERRDFKSALPYSIKLSSNFPEFELGLTLLKEIRLQLATI